VINSKAAIFGALALLPTPSSGIAAEELVRTEQTPTTYSGSQGIVHTINGAPDKFLVEGTVVGAAYPDGRPTIKLSTGKYVRLYTKYDYVNTAVVARLISADALSSYGIHMNPSIIGVCLENTEIKRVYCDTGFITNSVI